MSLQEDFFAGIPIPVEAELIDKELSRLWKPSPEPGRGQGGPAGAALSSYVTRACLSNLIFHAPEATDVQRTLKLARDVGRRIPSRVILLTHGEPASAGPPLRAWVTALCHSSSPDAAPVCCEQIMLAAERGAVDVFPGAVLPLLVPDVPVILVLPPGCCERTAAILEGIADRMVFDSRPAPLSALEIPLRALEARCRPCDELAWRQGLPWRSALCDIFDEPMARALLPDIRRLEIEYVPSGAAGETRPRARQGFPGAAPAALLGGWFAARLGWTFRGGKARDGELSATFERGGNRLSLLLRPREGSRGAAGRPGGPAGVPEGSAKPADRPAGEVAAVRLSAADDAFIDLQARADAAMFEVHHHTPTACVLPRRMPLPMPTEADLLGSAIERVTHQGVLRSALEIAARLPA